MKHSTYITLILLTVAFFKCSVQVTGVETTNGIVTATIVNEDGTPASHVPVFLMPLSYDPVKGSPLPDYLSDTTDENGTGTIVIEKEGSYNLLAIHSITLTRSFRPAIEVANDTVAVYDTLREPGAAKIELPDTVDTVTSYLYIPGTNRYQKLSEEVLFHVDNKIHVIFDYIPAGITPGIYFGKEDSLFNAIPLTAAFLVTSGDTVNITTQVEWLSFTTANSGLPSDNISSVIRDYAGILWVGTRIDGLAAFDNSSWVTYTAQNSELPNNSVQALAQEPDGTIWVGTNGGVASIKNTIWQVYTTFNSDLHNNYITAIAIDSAGNRWFGTNNGCAEFDGTNWKHHSGSFNSNIGAVYSITIDKQGIVLAGTGDGLFIYDKTEWKNIQVSDDEYQYNSIQDIAVDKNNVSWLATSKGLASYSDGECTTYDSIGADFFFSKLQSIAVDWNNTVWAGTFFEGCIVKAGNPVVIYNEVNTGVLKDVIRINDINVYAQNTIYFATEYEGIILIQFTSVY